MVAIGGGLVPWAAITVRSGGYQSGMAPKSGYLERETKLSATLGFDLPDLRDAAGRTEWLADEDLRSRYFDTPDLRLWSRGITLRHRTGERRARAPGR